MNIISSTVSPAVHPASAPPSLPPGGERKGRGVLLSRILLFLPETACLSAGNLGCKGLTTLAKLSIDVSDVFDVCTTESST